MLVIQGIQYLGEKEISAKYGLSLSWFRNSRYKGRCPTYHKLNGKIYYIQENVDSWFKENLKAN